MAPLQLYRQLEFVSCYYSQPSYIQSTRLLSTGVKLQELAALPPLNIKVKYVSLTSPLDAFMEGRLRPREHFIYQQIDKETLI
jgi:hypothetical protein